MTTEQKTEVAADIAQLHHLDYLKKLDKYAGDREMLLCIKEAVEKERREFKSRDRLSPGAETALKWMNRKLQDVDTALRNVKMVKLPGLQRTGGANAFTYALTLDGETWQEASMRNPAEYQAHLCRSAEDPDEIPAIVSFIAQPDIDSIPADWWDDTCPNNPNAKDNEAGAGSLEITRAS